MYFSTMNEFVKVLEVKAQFPIFEKISIIVFNYIIIYKALNSETMQYHSQEAFIST